MKKIKLEGLSSVFEKHLTTGDRKTNFSQEIVLLEVEMIFPGEFQPRKKFNEETILELAKSIEENGVLQPILVREKNISGEYEIIAGERRWRASKIAGSFYIPSIIVDADDVSCRAFSLLENIQRDSLTLLEEAYAYQKLIEEHALTHEQISQKTGKARTSITNSLRLLSLSKYILDCLDDEKISFGHAKVLLSCTVELRDTLCETIVAKKLSVRETELLLKKMNKSPIETKKENSPSVKQFEEIKYELIKIFGHQVKINSSVDGGIILNIKVNTLKKLENIVDRINLSFNINK